MSSFLSEELFAFNINGFLWALQNYDLCIVLVLRCLGTSFPRSECSQNIPFDFV